MKKLRLIIHHEYMTIVGRKSFIVMTILIPVMMIVLACMPLLFTYINDSTDSSVTRIAVIDSSPGFGKAFKSDAKYHYVVMSGDTKVKPFEFYKNTSSSIDAVMVIPSNVMETRQVELFSEKTLDESTANDLNKCLDDTLSKAVIASFNDPNFASKVEQSRVNASIKVKKWDENGEEQEQSAIIASLIGLGLTFFTMFFLMAYGAMIMNSVVEEKTNRIVEVIVSSCKPMELMMGKIIGVGLVGLTQIAIWVVLMGVAAAVFGMVGVATVGATGDVGAITAGMSMPQGAVDSEMAGILKALASINWFSIVGNFIIYFIGGYLLFASLFAGFSSAVDQASDSSQFSTPIIMIMLVGFYAGFACIQNPNGPMAVWCSLIPFTSPIVMMVRLPFDVPWWQQLLSVVLLYATALGCIWLSSRIYRTGILLYGKKRSFKEVIKWVR